MQQARAGAGGLAILLRVFGGWVLPFWLRQISSLGPVSYTHLDVYKRQGFGALAKLQRSIFVNRSRKMGLPAVNSAMAERMVEGAPVVLFAEATTSDGTHLMKFHAVHLAAARDLLKKYAAVDHVVVQPISIIYQAQHGLPMGRKGQPNIAWYGDCLLYTSRCV